MSDIAGPPAPRDLQPSVRGTDKAANVSRDPNQQGAQPRNNPEDQSTKDQGDALKGRDPAVSISATAAHLTAGQEIAEAVARIDAEGRPIIVTDSVTIALRPDAGLQPTDQITLKVVDTGKQATADLVIRNGTRVDPPVRLSVTVVEVHIKTPDQAPTRTPTSFASVPYERPAGTAPTVTANTIIPTGQASGQPIPAQGGPAPTAAQQPGTVPSSPPAPAASHTPTATVPPAATGAAQAPAASNPALASAQDLATLIEQQAQPTGQQPAAAAGSKTAAGQQAQAVAPAALSGPGIGPAIAAVTPSGTAATLQLLDPSVSQVSPREVATVQAVQPLSAQEARTLPLNSFAATGTAAPALARIDTNLGSFVLPAKNAEPLAGELVRVAVGQAAAASGTVAAQPAAAPQIGALLIENRPDALPERIAVRLVPQTAETAATPQNAQAAGPATVATIQQIQTVAAFLGPDGPKTDLRLQTTLGDVSFTVPSNQKPQVGDQLEIIRAAQPAPGQAEAAPLPRDSALPTEGVQAPGNSAAASSQAAAVAAGTAAQAAAAPAPNLLSSWPAMEESLAALVGTNAAAAGNLTSKTAQGGSKLTNSLLFFLAAAGRGGPAAWVGKETQAALQRASQSTLTRLSSDLQQMATVAADTAGEWRTILLPFDARAGEFPLAALLLGTRPDIDPESEHDGASPEEDDKEDAQRFILQVQFSILGDIQLDGAVRDKSFDLTVRSLQALPQPLQRDAADLFYASLAANDFTGAIDFKKEDAFAVDAAEVAAAQFAAQAGS